VPVFVVLVVFTDASAVGANVCVAVAAVVPPGKADAASVTPATAIAAMSVFARIAVNKGLLLDRCSERGLQWSGFGHVFVAAGRLAER
jgi:hypothetical protein